MLLNPLSMIHSYPTHELYHHLFSYKKGFLPAFPPVYESPNLKFLFL